MCSHEHKIIGDCHHYICTNCGTLLNACYDVSNMLAYGDWNHDVLCTPYARNKRFEHMVDSVCFAYETHNDRAMIEHLDNNKVTNLAQIRKYMKISKLIDKRYLSLHLFCKCFDRDYVTFKEIDYQMLIREKENMIKAFKYIELKYFSTHGRKV